MAEEKTIGNRPTGDGPALSPLAKRIRSFRHAARGLILLFKTARNAWIQIVVFLLAIALGIFFGISRLEWLAIILASGFVFTAEAFNSAIEIDIDLTSPEYHPFARDTKDLAAGAVLISAITATIVGLFIFIPRLI